MSVPGGGVRIMEALSNSVAVAWSNPQYSMPAIGCPPMKVKPFSLAVSNSGPHTARLTPHRSITHAPFLNAAACSCT